MIYTASIGFVVMAAAASYAEYLKVRGSTDGSDPLAADARKRQPR